MHVLSLSWEELTPPQRAALRPRFVRLFDQWSDFMGSFVTAELLGERYGDEESLDALCTLAATAKLPGRELVPHGLKPFLAGTDERLRARATAALRALTADPSSGVRREAEAALRRARS